MAIICCAICDKYLGYWQKENERFTHKHSCIIRILWRLKKAWQGLVK